LSVSDRCQQCGKEFGIWDRLSQPTICGGCWSAARKAEQVRKNTPVEFNLPAQSSITNLAILAAIDAKRERRESGFMPLILLVTSAFLFVAVGSYRWTLERAILLVAAIFAHECGHWAAMKIYRYKNLKILYIPFLGAVASGEPDEHDAYKIALISISAPIAGLAVAGLAMLAWMATKNRVLIEFAYP
jgi:hypothetical protein